MAFVLVGACAPTQPPAAPAAETDAAKTEATPAEPGPEATEAKETPAPLEDVPRTCADAPATPSPAPAAAPGAPRKEEPKLCVPDPDWVRRLCQTGFPDVALLLFSKDSTFTRMYLRGDVDGWNADGGASTRAKLAFDEEVLVLRRRAAAPTKGMVINGGGAGYLVMRWDGACYTVEDGEVTARRPPAAKHGPIPWKLYSDKTKDTLLQNPRVQAAFQKRGKECKGVESGAVAAACEKADATLADTVVAEVRAGLVVPQPERRP